MKSLFLTAMKDRRHYRLLAVIIVVMCLFIFASQLEILALGVISSKGNVDPGSQDKIQQAIRFVDQYFSISNNITNLVVALAAVACFKAITLFAHRFSTRVLSIRISRDLRQQYFEHIQTLPMEFYQKYNIGSLSSRVVGDAAVIGESINSILVNYLQTPFTVVSTMALCFMTSWQLSTIVFLGFPAIILPITFIAKHVRRISKQIQQNQEKFSSVLIDYLAGIQTIKVFGMEDFSLKKYKEQNWQMAKLEKKSARYDLSSRPIVHTIGMIFLSISLLWGLYVLKMSIAEAFFFCGLLYVFYEPVKKFAEENGRIQKGIAAAERLQEVMAIQSQIVDKNGAAALGSFEGPIEFKNVSFSYGDRMVLRNLNFTINKGEMVAIVGPTGAGKSTIVQLIPRLYDVVEGDILINGISTKSYTQQSLRENIAFVSQKPFLFLDTAAENISFGRPFSREEVIDAAKKAHADEFICKLPKGYDTMLAESGKNLSGGQQQRLAIARALVKNAPILIMDEATSSLDSVSERQIKDAIHSLKGVVTQIIIAHRLSTVEDADKIIYIDHGIKIAEGTKSELLQSCAGFKQMWDMMHGQKRKDEEESTKKSGQRSVDEEEWTRRN